MSRASRWYRSTTWWRLSRPDGENQDVRLSSMMFGEAMARFSGAGPAEPAGR
jgi:hypothetical protein